MSKYSFQERPDANLSKQLAAMLYDSILIFAVLLFAFGIALLLNRGEPIESIALRRIYLILCWFSYYAWFWQKSGQTLGMRAWKIRIITEDGRNPSWANSYLRLCLALLSFAAAGLGYGWRLFRPYTWHDKLSATRIIDVSSSETTNSI